MILGGTAAVAARDDTGPQAAKPHVAKTSPRPPGLSIASLGGGMQAAQQASLVTPFSDERGVHSQMVTWDGTLATLQRRAQTGTADPALATGATWDLVLMEEAPVRVACREGLFIADPRTADAETTVPDSPGRGCGVAAWRMNLVLAWDRSRVDMVPAWTDFWDVARRPGKRGLRRDPRSTLEIALLADGVAPEDVYRTLATGEGIDRAFRKLDQLKPYIVWWTTPAEAVQIIESGAVLMTSAPSGEIATANQTGHRSFGVQWAQSLGVTFSWAMPRATTPGHRALAQQFLAFLADPSRQAAFLASYEAVAARGQPAPGGSRSPASPVTPAASDGPGTDEHLRATLMMDDDFWAGHLVALRRRFEAWINSK